MKAINTSKNNPALTHRLLEWYLQNKRDLPWRDTQDPFKIWLSEIILQQTRVDQGLPYYQAFANTYENVEAFAHAPLDEILKMWQGLGYYSRARNMHACAQTVVNEFKGQFPNNYKDLLSLKGIGKYTAAAISSICFDEAVPAVDGNVFRVHSRLFGISEDIAKGKTFNTFFDLGKELIQKNHPGTYNQAMMEYGAKICTPKSPKCDECVVSEWCFALKNDMTHLLPMKVKNIKVKQREFHYYIYKFENWTLIRQRPAGDICTVLYEFVLEEGETPEMPEATPVSEVITHLLTHQKLSIQFHVVMCPSLESMEQIRKEKDMLKTDISSLTDFAVPKPIEMFLNKVDL